MPPSGPVCVLASLPPSPQQSSLPTQLSPCSHTHTHTHKCWLCHNIGSAPRAPTPLLLSTPAGTETLRQQRVWAQLPPVRLALPARPQPRPQIEWRPAPRPLQRQQPARSRHQQPPSPKPSPPHRPRPCLITHSAPRQPPPPPLVVAAAGKEPLRKRRGRAQHSTPHNNVQLLLWM